MYKKYTATGCIYRVSRKNLLLNLKVSHVGHHVTLLNYGKGSLYIFKSLFLFYRSVKLSEYTIVVNLKLSMYCHFQIFLTEQLV